MIWPFVPSCTTVKRTYLKIDIEKWKACGQVQIFKNLIFYIKTRRKLKRNWISVLRNIFEKLAEGWYHQRISDWRNQMASEFFQQWSGALQEWQYQCNDYQKIEAAFNYFCSTLFHFCLKSTSLNRAVGTFSNPDSTQ